MRPGITEMGIGIMIPVEEVITAISDLESGIMIPIEDIAINTLEIAILIIFIEMFLGRTNAKIVQERNPIPYPGTGEETQARHKEGGAK
jgi:hypothetical protein